MQITTLLHHHPQWCHTFWTRMLQSEGVHNLCSHIYTVDRELLSFWHPIHTWIFPLYINLVCFVKSVCLMLHLPPSRSTALWQMDAKIKTEMSVIFLREIHVDAVKLIFCSMNTLEDAFFFPPLTFSSHVKCRCGSLSHSCANKHQNEGGKEMTAVRRRKEKSAYIIRVDVPCHVSIRNKLSVDVASDFTVPPAAVYVNYTDHVPLRGEKRVR